MNDFQEDNKKLRAEAAACIAAMPKEKAELKRITELEEKLKAFEWKQIETAPKDMTRIIAYTNDGYKVPLIAQCLWDNGWWPDTFESIDEPLKPTHWMPLPAAPKS